jgi:hypothetical protein
VRLAKSTPAVSILVGIEPEERNHGQEPLCEINSETPDDDRQCSHFAALLSWLLREDILDESVQTQAS